MLEDTVSKKKTQEQLLTKSQTSANLLSGIKTTKVILPTITNDKN
jgi:hypothetical protein